VRDIAHAWRCSEAQVQQLQHHVLTELRRRTAPPCSGYGRGDLGRRA
jgi:hypothetical protein